MKYETDYYANNAEYYDYISPGHKGDVEFYVEEARGAGSPVLELACGTGRLLLPVAQAGIEVTGLDISQPMLTVAKRKIAAQPRDVQNRITIQEGDMRGFELGRKFKLAFIAYGSFLHILTPEDQRKTITVIREHLEDAGKLIINIFDPRWDIIAAHMGPGGTSLRRLAKFRNQAGHDVVVWDSRLYDPGNQMATQDRMFEELDEEGNVIGKRYSTIELRWSYRWEMQYLFELCGFEVESLYSDFQRTEFVPGNQQIWVVRKTG